MNAIIYVIAFGFRRITVSDVHQCIPKHDVFKVFSSERQQEEVINYDDKLLHPVIL